MKNLFLSEEDRQPGSDSCYHYIKSKPVTAVKTKRDEDGFFIPWAMFRPLGEKGLLCNILGESPVNRAADLRMNRDLLLKEVYEHEVERMLCRIRLTELHMQQIICKEDQAMELYRQGKLQHEPKITPDEKRKMVLDAVTWKYDCVQNYKKICFQFADAVIRASFQGEGVRNQSNFIEQFIRKANELPEANRLLLDMLYEIAWRTIYVFKYGGGTQTGKSGAAVGTGKGRSQAAFCAGSGTGREIRATCGVELPAQHGRKGQ